MGEVIRGGARSPKRLNRSPSPWEFTLVSPEQRDPHTETFSPAPGTMAPLKTVLLVAVLLGALLQDTHAGESRGKTQEEGTLGKEGWGR